MAIMLIRETHMVVNRVRDEYDELLFIINRIQSRRVHVDLLRK